MSLCPTLQGLLPDSVSGKRDREAVKTRKEKDDERVDQNIRKQETRKLKAIEGKAQDAFSSLKVKAKDSVTGLFNRSLGKTSGQQSTSGPGSSHLSASVNDGDNTLPNTSILEGNSPTLNQDSNMNMDLQGATTSIQANPVSTPEDGFLFADLALSSSDPDKNNGDKTIHGSSDRIHGGKDVAYPSLHHSRRKEANSQKSGNKDALKTDAMVLSDTSTALVFGGSSGRYGGLTPEQKPLSGKGKDSDGISILEANATMAFDKTNVEEAGAQDICADLSLTDSSKQVPLSQVDIIGVIDGVIKELHKQCPGLVANLQKLKYDIENHVTAEVCQAKEAHGTYKNQIHDLLQNIELFKQRVGGQDTTNEATGEFQVENQELNKAIEDLQGCLMGHEENLYTVENELGRKTDQVRELEASLKISEDKVRESEGVVNSLRNELRTTQDERNKDNALAEAAREDYEAKIAMLEFTIESSMAKLNHRTKQLGKLNKSLEYNRGIGQESMVGLLNRIAELECQVGYYEAIHKEAEKHAQDIRDQGSGSASNSEMPEIDNLPTMAGTEGLSDYVGYGNINYEDVPFAGSSITEARRRSVHQERHSDVFKRASGQQPSTKRTTSQRSSGGFPDVRGLQSFQGSTAYGDSN